MDDQALAYLITHVANEMSYSPVPITSLFGRRRGTMAIETIGRNEN